MRAARDADVPRAGRPRHDGRGVPSVRCRRHRRSARSRKPVAVARQQDADVPTCRSRARSSRHTGQRPAARRPWRACDRVYDSGTERIRRATPRMGARSGTVAARARSRLGRGRASMALGTPRGARPAAGQCRGGAVMSLRVLLVMDPFIKVPPDHYGGIERVVADLADGLHARGHEVTLWAAPGSATAARLEAFGREGEWTPWSNLRNVALTTRRFLRMNGHYDVIHNFGRLAYLAGVLRRDVPKVQTYMRTVNPRNMRLVTTARARRLHFTAVSDAIRQTGAPGGGDWSVIYNCARPSAYIPRLDVDASRAPLVFLGRLDRCKGAHSAIAVARVLGRELVIAGNISPLAHERAYFKREVEPLID